ncbi:hypothetical protein K438DRAFT_1773549 [Mycena galopus ATCC 62051]|nr:hypothetical protein K438DRAFT_1773549 [Mycena galopus ATCC 62051]
MCFSLRCKDSKNGSYFLQSRLRGHSSAILRLCATEDGRFLASGGKPTTTDGTKVWDLRTMRELGSPESPKICGASTALVWIKREDDLRAKCHSTGQSMVNWFAGRKQNKMHVQLLYGFSGANLIFTQGLSAFEETSCVYILSSTMPLREVYTLQLLNVVPAAVAFSQLYGNEPDIMVFRLYGGEIGDVALDTRKGVLCMDESSSGVNLYCLDDHTHVKTFRVPVTKQQCLRRVNFLDDCQFIVSGSDHGMVYVFNRRSGIVDELEVDAREWVQTVAAADCARPATIFAAKLPDLVGLNDIVVWRRKSQQQFGGGGIGCIRILIQLLCVVSAVAFMYQNLNTIRLYQM